MRISDWSSDVCFPISESNIRHKDVIILQRKAGDRKNVLQGNGLNVGSRNRFRHISVEQAYVVVARPRAVADAHREKPDERKRGVKGKSGSVRVDHGGGRSIKKKKTKE